MAKDPCIEYEVSINGINRKCTNDNFIDVLVCVDREYQDDNALTRFFSIRRAEKIISEYCRRHFNVEISRREISSICYPQRGKFPVRAGIILMAAYNLLKTDSCENENARAYIVRYMREKHDTNNQGVVSFFFGDIPATIQEEYINARRASAGERKLWGYYCSIDRRLTLIFRNETWMSHVKKCFPAELFGKLETLDNHERVRNGRVYLLKGEKLSQY